MLQGGHPCPRTKDSGPGNLQVKLLFRYEAHWVSYCNHHPYLPYRAVVMIKANYVCCNAFLEERKKNDMQQSRHTLRNVDPSLHLSLGLISTQHINYPQMEMKQGLNYFHWSERVMV